MISFLINALKIIIMLGFLVLIHEGGHFLIAKLFKVKVNEFSIGFGKALIMKKKGETRYALRLIPLGGYVSLEGEETPSNVEGSFSKCNVGKKIAIVAAGAIVNIIFGILVFFVLSLAYKHDVYYALINTKQFCFSILDGLRNLFGGGFNVNQLTGIVGISDVIVSTKGLQEYIYIIAVISISLGVTNLLPFPPLDGGKILIYIIESIRKKPLKEETELRIQTWGFTILIALSIYITYRDIIRIF